MRVAKHYCIDKSTCTNYRLKLFVDLYCPLLWEPLVIKDSLCKVTYLSFVGMPIIHWHGIFNPVLSKAVENHLSLQPVQGVQVQSAATVQQSITGTYLSVQGELYMLLLVSCILVYTFVYTSG